MNIYKKIGGALLLFLGLLFILAMWYKYAFSMDEATPLEINAPSLEQKVLIATQGSEFKDKVVFHLTQYYKVQSVYASIIDVKSLKNVHPEEYSAIIVIHTWEYGKPPQVVQEFIDRTKVYEEKIVVLTTSGEGTYKMEGVDAITGESILLNADTFSEKIIEKVDEILIKHTPQ